MYVNHDKRAVFIAHPRTASTSLRACLLRRGWEGVGEHHQVIPSSIEKDMLVFSVIREPADWIVSWYGRSRRNQEFGAWLKQFLDAKSVIVRTAPYVLPTDENAFYGLSYSDFVLFHDRLSAGLRIICEKLKIEEFALPRLEQSTLRPRSITPENLALMWNQRKSLFHLYDVLEEARNGAVLHGGKCRLRVT